MMITILEKPMAMNIEGNSPVVRDLQRKLKNLPPIFYLNLDHRTDRREFIENQFDLLNIKNYTRVSADRFSVDNFNTWKDKILSITTNETARLSTLLNQIQLIVDWYDSKSSEYCLVIEDDINFLTARFWPFSWSYFFNRLPCHWDCVQLHVIGEYFIPMGLTKRCRNNHSAACLLINRRFAKKLKEMHYIDGKFKFHTNYGYSKYWPEYHYQSADFVPYEVGVTYTFPLFVTNSNLISDSYINSTNYMARKSDLVTLTWWKENAQHYALTDLFTRDSKKRQQLNIDVNYGTLRNSSQFQKAIKNKEN